MAPQSNEIQIRLKIYYEGQKARNLQQGKASEAFVVHTLLSDLNYMRLPHPKKASIELEFDGCITFCWYAKPHSVRPYFFRNLLTERMR